jgi:hypothetical protein
VILSKNWPRNFENKKIKKNFFLFFGCGKIEPSKKILAWLRKELGWFLAIWLCLFCRVFDTIGFGLISHSEGRRHPPGCDFGFFFSLGLVLVFL